MSISNSPPLLIWVFQTGEPLHIDEGNARPMRAMNLSNALARAGHRVVLWSTAFYHQEKLHRSATAQVLQIADLIEIRLIPSRGYRRHISLDRLIDHIQLAFNLKKMLEHSGPLPDVAFIGYPPIETAAVLARWLAKHDVPSLLDVKDQWPSLFLDAIPGPLRLLGRIMLWPYFYLARRAMREATGLSAMASSFLDWTLVVAQRARTDRDGVFPLTSPLGQVSASQREAARRWWDDRGIKDNGCPRVCFVGSHSQSFDFKPVQEAAKIAAKAEPRCEFVICGDGAFSAELRAMMSGLPNVYFPGWIDRPKILVLAERCRAALAPYLNIDSFQKSIPNKIIDALSVGLPILSPLQGEVATLITESGVGIRYGTDTGKTLHDCIQALMQDGTLQQGMSQKAHDLYAERFSFEMVYGELVNHLEKLAGSNVDCEYHYYNLITENPGQKATIEQIARLWHRYRFAGDYTMNNRVLEVACGSGIGLGYLAEKARKVVGLDIDNQNVATASQLYGIVSHRTKSYEEGQSRYEGNKIEVCLMDAHQLDFPDKTFDLALLYEALYYLRYPDTFFAEANRILSDNGILIICTVNKDWSDFHPSPYAYRYFSAPELHSTINKHFSKVDLFGAFPVNATGIKNLVFSRIKHIAVSLDLIPGTLAARAYLKRVFLGPLKPLPDKIYENMAPYAPPVPIPHDQPNRNYKILYAVARKERP